MKYSHKLPDSSVNVTEENILYQTLKLLSIFLILGVLSYFLLNATLNYVVEKITPAQEKQLIALIDFTPVMENESKSAYLQELTDRLAPVSPYLIQSKPI